MATQYSANREFKKFWQLLQGNCNVKIKKNCIKLSVLSFVFHVGRVLQNRQSALYLDWHKIMVFMSKQRMEDLQLWVCIVRTTSKMKISCHCLADCLKKIHLNHMCSTIIFPHSANEIIHLWHCCCFCGRHFLNFLWSSSIQLLQNFRSLYVRILLCKVMDVLIVLYSPLNYFNGKFYY